MHEASIAQSLMDIILDTAKSHDAKVVTKVFVKIGKLTAIEKDALSFAYDVIKEETIAENSELVVEEVPICGECLDCGKSSEYDNFVFDCRHCGSFNVKLVSGEELQITEIEVD